VTTIQGRSGEIILELKRRPGAALRFAYVLLNGFSIPPNEVSLEASAFAARGELADAFGPGTGLTAHLSPGMPLLVGTIYRWLGVGTPLAEFALSCVSLVFIYVSFLALDAGFQRLGAEPIARLGAVVLLALVPLNLYLEMTEFRHWEGAVAAAGIALFLASALALDARDERPTWLELGLLGGCAGLLGLFSPPGALGCYGMLGWLALRKRGWAGFVAAAALSAALFVAISYPWALRNEAVFGEKVWARTSFGFNFALGYYDEAVNPSHPRKVYFDRFDQLIPTLPAENLAKVKAAGGEVGYSRLWTARTEEWIGQHPVDALKITARHVRHIYFPPGWLWGANPGVFELTMTWTIAFLGLVSLGVRLASRDWRYIYPAAALLLPMFPYVVAEPWIRYRYPIGGILVFLAADLVWRIVLSALRRPSRLPVSPALVFR
jgi:hypothetical protein